MKTQKELVDGDTEGVDLVVCLGGDSTVLRTSGYCKTCETPILGINTTPNFEKGFLINL